MRYEFSCTCLYPPGLEEGPSLDLPCLEAVRMAAMRLAIDIRDRVGPEHWRGWIIEAADELGRVVLTLEVSPEFPDLALARESQIDHRIRRQRTVA